jgi:hypothetical protein
MPPPSTSELHTLPERSIEKLAQIFQVRRYEQVLAHSNRVTAAIASLPKELKRTPKPSGLTRLLSSASKRSNSHTSKTHVNKPAPPCLLHQAIAQEPIHEILFCIHQEVTSRTSKLVSHRHWLSPGQLLILDCLQQIQALWLPPHTYTELFDQTPKPQWSFQESRCEGCMLTRIGSEPKVLVSLRALLQSRTVTHRNKSKPRLTPVVDAWMKGFGGEAGSGRKLLDGAKKLGEELKIVRKQIWREKNGTLRAQGKPESGVRIEEDVPEEVVCEETDWEGDMIDEYAHEPSSLGAPSVADADPTPLRFGTATGHRAFGSQSTHHTSNVHNQPPQTLSQDLRDHFTGTRFSFEPPDDASTYIPPRTERAWQGRGSSEQQAEGYRDLLRSPETEQPTPKPAAKGKSRPITTCTTWGAFCE